MNYFLPEPAFIDERGIITDLIVNQNINAITSITFQKDAVRANHYHKKTIQWNYILKGKILLATQFLDGEKKIYELHPGHLAVTYENESHALKALCDSEVLIFTSGPRAGKQYEEDTYRLEKSLF